MQPVNRVTVALTTALPLEASLKIPSTRLQKADTNTTAVKFAGDGDSSGPGPDDADVREDFLIIRHRLTDHRIITDFRLDVTPKHAAERRDIAWYRTRGSPRLPFHRHRLRSKLKRGPRSTVALGG
jgi:hypothetical protein